MKIFKSPSNNEQEINITPLIDIIFILLVFFMVSSSFLKPVINIKLPVASTKDNSTSKKISLSLTEDLSLYLDKDKISIEDLQVYIFQALQNDPELVVMLSCDRSIIFEHVVYIIDALKLAGVKNVAISHLAQ